VCKASRGDLEWHITLPEDGRLHWDGVVPYLIEWGPKHPTDTLPDVGCRLVELVLRHPEPQAVDRVLRSLELDWRLVRLEHDESPQLVALLQTPAGLKWLQ